MATRRPQTTKARRSQLPVMIGMLIVAFIIVAAVAAWRSVDSGGDAVTLSERVRTFLLSLVWPGAAIFAGALAVLWAGWKLDLD